MLVRIVDTQLRNAARLIRHPRQFSEANNNDNRTLGPYEFSSVGIRSLENCDSLLVVVEDLSVCFRFVWLPVSAALTFLVSQRGAAGKSGFCFLAHSIQKIEHYARFSRLLILTF
jgi:hypothetical protein